MLRRPKDRFMLLFARLFRFLWFGCTFRYSQFCPKQENRAARRERNWYPNL
jgi:hypothetical protein